MSMQSEMKSLKMEHGKAGWQNGVNQTGKDRNKGITHKHVTFDKDIGEIEKIETGPHFGPPALSQSGV